MLAVQGTTAVMYVGPVLWGQFIVVLLGGWQCISHADWVSEAYPGGLDHLQTELPITTSTWQVLRCYINQGGVISPTS